MTHPEAFYLAGNGRLPNSSLPVQLYRGALPAGAAVMECVFADQGWSSMTRTAPAATQSTSTMLPCGPSGQEVALQCGDAIVIFAGVAHRNIGQSVDLRVAAV